MESNEKNTKRMYIISPENMIEKIKEYFNEDRKNIFLCSVILGIIVHFLLLASLITSQDGLMHILHYSAGGYEVSLGRWGIDFFDSLRNDIAIPFITTIISIIVLAITNILLLDLFEFKNKIFKFLTVFAFVASPGLCMTLLYTYTADVYFWAMLLSVFTVYAFYKIKNKKIGTIFGMISFIMMLSTYQSYMGMTIGLIVILNIKRLITEENSNVKVLKDLIFKALIIIVSAVLYYLITVILLKVLSLDMTTYGGLNDLTLFGIIGSIFSSVKNAYLGFVKYFFADGIILNRTWKRDILYGIFFVIAFIAFIKLFINKLKEYKCLDKEKKKNIKIDFWVRYIFIAFLCVLFPVFLNIVVVVAPGNEIYYLTSTQIVLVIPFVFMIFELIYENKNFVNLLNWGVILIVFVILITYVFSIVVTYQTIELSYNQAKSIATRILMKIEEVPGYRKDMNYLFAGVIDDVNSPKTLDIYNFTLNNTFRGSLFHGTYWGQQSTWKNFMNTYTGVNINFCSDYEYYLIINSEEFKQMDIFPGENSVKMINDVMVVKFIDNPAFPPLSDELVENGISY